MSSPDEIFCILGIGNPGDEYADTKHNVGWRVLDELAGRHKIDIRRNRLQAIFGRGKVAGRQVVLAKPQTFVNASGNAALRLAIFFRIKLGNLLVVLDDMNLPPGALRLRGGGSDGGHKGLRSIIETFGTADVPRLRIGIGQPQGPDAVNWVLSPFGKDVLPDMEKAFSAAADCIETFIADGIDAAMSRFNG